MTDSTTGVPDEPGQPQQSEIPQYIGNYQLVRLIGSGAMGEVYLAQHRKFANREYAIKLIRQDVASEGARKRFEREILAMGGLEHPNLVFANDAGVDHGRMYLVMEYVRGKDLQQLIETRGPFQPPQAAEIIRQICAGLSHAHAQGVVHRDIKPANVLLSNDLQVKVLDLGIASLQSDVASRMTGGGSLMGTAAFIAPELWDDASNASPASDVYAIGCTAYSLCTGSPPFSGDQYRSLVQVMKAHRQNDPEPLHLLRGDVAKEMSMVVLRALSKDPHRRYQDADEFAEAISPHCQPLSDDLMSGFVVEDLATVYPDAVSDTGAKSKRDTLPGPTTGNVEEELAVGAGTWIASLVMLLLAAVSLSIAYLGDFATPIWNLVYGQLGDPQNHALLGLATDSARVLVGIPLACYVLARYYASEIRQTLNLRDWSGQTLLARIVLVALCVFLIHRVVEDYWIVSGMATKLAQESASIGMASTASQELASVRWYFGYAIVAQTIFPLLTLAFPMTWFAVRDLVWISSQTKGLILRQKETSYPGRMSENLRRFASGLRRQIGRVLATFFVAALVLQYDYWLGVFTVRGLRQTMQMQAALWTSLTLGCFVVVTSAIVCLAYQRGFEVTNRMIAACGSIGDEDDLSRIGAGWLLRKSVFDRLSGIGCLSIVLIFAHWVYAYNRDPAADDVAVVIDRADIPEQREVQAPQEPKVVDASWMPANCVAAPGATLVGVEVRGFKQMLYSQVLLRANFPARTPDMLIKTPHTSDLDEITFLLVPQTSIETPVSFYIMRSKVQADLFREFEKSYPEHVDTEASKRRNEESVDGQQPAFNVTAREAISFAALVCGGMLPTPQQWDVAFGRFYDESLVRKAIGEWKPTAVTEKIADDVTPWGCREMSSGGLEFTRYDAQWRMLVPHNEAPHSLQLRGRSQFTEEGPLRLQDWEESGLPENLLFGARPIDEPSEEIGFRVVLNQEDE